MKKDSQYNSIVTALSSIRQNADAIEAAIKESAPGHWAPFDSRRNKVYGSVEALARKILSETEKAASMTKRLYNEDRKELEDVYRTSNGYFLSLKTLKAAARQEQKTVTQMRLIKKDGKQITLIAEGMHQYGFWSLTDYGKGFTIPASGIFEEPPIDEQEEAHISQTIGLCEKEFRDMLFGYKAEPINLYTGAESKPESIVRFLEDGTYAVYLTERR